MRAVVSLPAILLCCAVGGADVLAQQRQEGSQIQRQDEQGQTAPRSGPSQGQVRSFYEQMEQTLRQGVRNQNPRQATQFIRRHLSEDASFVTSNTLSINGRQVAQMVVTLDDDALSDILGHAGSAMHGGGPRNVQNYRLQIDVRDIEPIRGMNAVRVKFSMRDEGQIRPGRETSDRGQQGDRQRQAQLEDDHDERQQQRSRNPGLDEDNGQRGSISRGLGSGPLQFQRTAQCEQTLRTGTDGQIRIGNTLCRGNMQIEN